EVAGGGDEERGVAVAKHGALRAPVAPESPCAASGDERHNGTPTGRSPPSRPRAGRVEVSGGAPGVASTAPGLPVPRPPWDARRTNPGRLRGVRRDQARGAVVDPGRSGLASSLDVEAFPGKHPPFDSLGPAQ